MGMGRKRQTIGTKRKKNQRKKKERIKRKIEAADKQKS